MKLQERRRDFTFRTLKHKYWMRTCVKLTSVYDLNIDTAANDDDDASGENVSSHKHAFYEFISKVYTGLPSIEKV